MIRALIEEARPKQWAKNVLVFAAPAAAGVLDEAGAVARSVGLFVAMCLAASGAYFWNDIFDVDADRVHPTKRQRPVARGVTPLPVARVAGTGLLVAGVGLALVLRWQAGVVVACYVAVTLAYSVTLKHVAVVDLATVAAGFVLRAIAGAAVVDVRLSTWFVLCTSFGSLFIVAGKRYAELRELGDEAAEHRATLDEYSLGSLRTVLTIAAASSMVTYCVWAFETQDGSGSDTPFAALSIVPMLTAMLRYTLIVEQGHGSAPEEIFADDRTLQLLGMLWLGLFLLAVYAA